MKKDFSYAITAATFFFIVAAMSLWLLFSPKEDASLSERRLLAEMPELSWQSVTGGAFFDGFDAYITDHFPSRDKWRGVKARFALHILGEKENDSLAVKNGYIAKIGHGANVSSKKNAAAKMRRVYEKYLSGRRVFFSVVPDKSFFFARDFGYPSSFSESDIEFLKEALPEFEYIDIFDTLSLDCYYKTDAHWSQDKLGATVKKLADAMGFSEYVASEHETRRIDGFYGVYAGQSALSPPPDTIFYLTNENIENLSVRDARTGELFPVYDLKKADGRDKYDVFLSGSRGILKIDDPNAKSERKLIVFRDSFGSSIAPLFIGAYKSITLIDTRYIETEKLGEYVDFENQDVLFLYSTLLIANSFSLK